MIRVGWLASRNGFFVAALWVITFAWPCAAQAQATRPSGVWVNVTSNVGEPKWGYAGVTLLAAVPGSNRVIAGVSEAGLWETSDGGKTWTKLGAKDAVPIMNRPYQIVFDPKDSSVFWESGNYAGPGLFKTIDGGKTFQSLGKLTHLDGVGIDFTDPERKMLVVGHHEQSCSVEKSTDGGLTWTNIGQSLPADTNFSSDPIVQDANTFIVNAAGWKKDASFGIYRTTDGGKSWKKICDQGPAGIPCITPAGAIYWQALWAKGLLKSEDHGLTWNLLPGPVKDNPIALPDGKLMAAVDRQLMISADGGKSWQKTGPEIPFKPTGICFSERGRAVYVWRSTEAREDNVILKWEMP